MRSCNRNRLMPALIPVLALFSSVAVCEPYIGVSAGAANYKVDFSSLGAGMIDDSGAGTRLYGGYIFNDYLAAEAAYYNFAEASVGAVETSPGSGVFVSAAASMKGFGGYAVGIYPVTKKFDLLAKLGLLSWDADLDVNGTAGSNSGTDAAFALGASYAFTKELQLVAEWESFQSDNPELSMLSIGFRFVFR